MADYAKKKNDELAALCKERGLAHTGKKADLVKRLEDHDATSSAPAASKPALEDEIDWDDEPATEIAKVATTEPAADALAAGGVGVQVPNPQAVPNQVAAEDPAQTNDLTVAAAPTPDPTNEAPPAPAVEAKEPEKDFSSGIADRTIDEEIEKRKARARRFGLPEDTDDIKALERAKRFGETDLPGLMNKALPNDRKRGRDGAEHDGGIRKRSRGPQRGRGMGRRQESGRKEKERAPAGGSGGGGYPAWMTQGDKEAADRRKAKFAT